MLSLMFAPTPADFYSGSSIAVFGTSIELLIMESSPVANPSILFSKAF